MSLPEEELSAFDQLQTFRVEYFSRYNDTSIDEFNNAVVDAIFCEQEDDQEGPVTVDEIRNIVLERKEKYVKIGNDFLIYKHKVTPNLYDKLYSYFTFVHIVSKEIANISYPDIAGLINNN